VREYSPTSERRMNMSGILGGEVTDTKNKPLDGVLVTASSGGTEVGWKKTDGAGGYNFESLPDGTYEVTASKSGYKDGTFTGINVSPSADAIVDFILEES
jgi:hypothetical protein